MLQTTDVNAQRQESVFYSKPFSFSYSSLNKLLVSPNILYKEYILKDREDSTAKYLLEGILIHYLVLENEGFDDKFITLADSLPGDTNIAVAKIAFTAYEQANDPYLELKDFRSEILQALVDINKHQSLKDTTAGTGDDKRVAKIVEPKTEEYFEFLKNKKGRTIIDSALLEKCERRADVVKANSEIMELLGKTRTPIENQFAVYNELPLDCAPENDAPYGFKGILDNLTVDVATKTVRINDFKTTSKKLEDFGETVKIWNYWLQAAVYVKLVKCFLSKILTPEWNIEFRFIVFDKYDHLYPFLVKQGTLESWEKDFEEVQKEALYHYTTRDYKLPYAYAKGLIKL